MTMVVRAGVFGALVAGGAAFGQNDAGAWNRDFGKLSEQAPPYRGPGIVGTALGPGGSSARGFDSGGTTLLSWLSLTDFAPDMNSGNDCWGYTSPTGREVAIMGMDKGFGFVDISDPVNPQILAVVRGETSMWRDVKVVGHYAYGVNEAGNGIQVIDLSQVDQGVVTFVKDKRQQGHSTTHNIAANPDSGYLYLCGANIANGGLVAVSTANPTEPTIVGAWTGRYVHDAQIVTYTSGPYSGRELAFCCNGSKVRVLDVTDKSNMHEISQITYSGARYCHQGWLSADRRYFYVDDEFDEVKGRDQTTTHIFDVSDPANPMYVGWGTSGLPASDHNLYWHEQRLYQANYHSGLQVLDAADPTNLARVAWFDTHPETDKAGFGGSWSCFPFFDSGSVLVSDMGRGLFVVKLGEPCAADFNGDGEVNTLDVAAFLNAWAADDAGADLNGDGEVNTLDVAAFLNAWTAGC
jgi:choice-of-anchor B domain-containing protein